MKQLLLVAICLGTILMTEAQQLKTPQPSTTQTQKQEFGLGSIELSYSRPNMKGRKVFGDLVPFDKVWRTGANNATTLTFTDDVTIGGTKVPAGKYGLLSIPSANEWTLIISKQTDVTSPSAYKQEMDVVRVKVKPMELPWSFETFGISFENITDNSCDLMMAWDKTLVSLPITTDVDGKVMKQIETIMKSDSRPYFAAASYYANNGKDLNQAIAWYDKAIEQNPKAFWVYYQKASTLAKLGKKTEAIAVSNKSIELAKEAKNDDYVALNEKLQKDLK
jgi:tetratricopeptide (TPR) repeat protein